MNTKLFLMLIAAICFLVIAGLLVFIFTHEDRVSGFDEFEISNKLVIFDEDSVEQSSVYNGTPETYDLEQNFEMTRFNTNEVIYCSITDTASRILIGQSTQEFAVDNELFRTGSYYTNAGLSKDQAVSYLLGCMNK